MLSRFVFAASTSALVALAACSSSSSGSSGGGGCNTDPFSCPSGQTCWPKDSAGNFACLNSKAGAQKGDTCMNYPGTPTCGERMFCLQQTVSGGTCVTYCDPSNPQHACGTGEQCTPVALAGTNTAQVHVCYGGSVTPDAGAHDSGGTTSDAGTDAAPPDAAGD